MLLIRAQQQIEAYKQQLKGKQSLKQRLNKLAEIRTDEGYIAQVQTQPDGSFLLVENHCPICAAATPCTGLCALELETFQSVLGDEVNIQRKKHIIAREQRCAYQIGQR